MHPRPPCNGDTVLQHACHRRRSVVDFRSRDWRALASAICSTSASATAAPAAATCTAVRPHKHSQATLQAVAPVLPARAPWSVAIDLLHAAQPRGPQTACPALSSTPLARTYLTSRARTSAGWCVWACAARRVRVARASSDKQRRKERSASRCTASSARVYVAPVPTGALRRPADCGGGMARFEAEVRAGGRGERGRDGAAMRGGCGVRKGPTGRSGVTCASRVRARARGKGQGQTAPVGWGTRPHTRCLARSGAGRTQATLAVAALRGGAALWQMLADAQREAPLLEGRRRGLATCKHARAYLGDARPVHGSSGVPQGEGVVRQRHRANGTYACLDPALLPLSTWSRAFNQP